MPLLLRSEEHTSELQSPCNLVCLFCLDRKSTRLNSSHLVISYAVFCLKKKKSQHSHGALPSLTGSVVRQAGGVRSGVQPQLFCFFFNDAGTTEIYILSLHDALPI